MLHFALASLLLVSAVDAQEAQSTSTVLVAARDLPRGHVLVAADITVPVEAPGAPEQPHALPQPQRHALPQPGWITRRTIQEGEVLRAPAVVPPSVIARGDTVRVHWRTAGLEISRTGISMGEASLGDLIQVRVGALHRVSAVATGPSTVLVK